MGCDIMTFTSRHREDRGPRLEGVPAGRQPRVRSCSAQHSQNIAGSRSTAKAIAGSCCRACAAAVCRMPRLGLWVPGIGRHPKLTRGIVEHVVQ